MICKSKINSYFLVVLWFACFFYEEQCGFFPLGVRWHGVINLKQRNTSWTQLAVCAWLLRCVFSFSDASFWLDQDWLQGAAPCGCSGVRIQHCSVASALGPYPSACHFGSSSCIWGKKVHSCCLFSTWHVCWAVLRVLISSGCAGAVCDVCVCGCVHFEHQPHSKTSSTIWRVVIFWKEMSS